MQECVELNQIILRGLAFVALRTAMTEIFQKGPRKITALPPANCRTYWNFTALIKPNWFIVRRVLHVAAPGHAGGSGIGIQ